MAVNFEANIGFFGKNETVANEHINTVNTKWLSWYGSLTEGPINFACITEDTEDAMKYCDAFGQPYAPAANKEDEIYSIMDYSKIPQFLLDRRGV